MQQQYDVENIFFKFDDDCSGSLDCDELQQMFEQNGIQIDLKDIKRMFDTVDTSKNGSLDLKKFKEFISSKESGAMFKQIIKQLRDKRRLADGRYVSPQQLPFNFNNMLEYLCATNKRQEIISDINRHGVQR